MGIYRLFLAALVAISHAGIYLHGYNQGVVAVISFYLLSGYVMTLLIEKYYRQPSTIPTFYMDRAARLFPQFLFYMGLAAVLIYSADIKSQYLTQLDATGWVLNFLMLPEAFYMYWADGALVLPQSWSLGLELTFYLVIPWLLVYCSRKQVHLLAALSFGVFLAAFLGVINTNHFGYRLLPGTLFIFLVGSSFVRDDAGSRRFRAVVCLCAGAMLLAMFVDARLFALRYNREVLPGLLLGILALGLLRRARTSSLDRFCGDLSYGVFLNHFIVIWTMQRFFGVEAFSAGNALCLVLASCVLAWCSFHLVEQPALRWRHALRNRTRQGAPVAAQADA